MPELNAWAPLKAPFCIAAELITGTTWVLYPTNAMQYKQQSLRAAIPQDYLSLANRCRPGETRVVHLSNHPNRVGFVGHAAWKDT